MRGIGKGQTIELLVVPEIKCLLRKELGGEVLTGNVEDDVAAWLQVREQTLEEHHVWTEEYDV